MKKILLGTLTFLITFSNVLAVGTTDDEMELTRFEKITNIAVEGIVTPKVVKFETDKHFDNKTVLLNEDGNVIDHRWVRSYEKVGRQNIQIATVSSEFEGSKNYLVDGSYETSFAFHPEDEDVHTMVLKFDSKTEVSGIYITPDDGIIPPKKVSVRGKFDSEFVNIIDNIDFQYRIPFPEVNVTELEISLTSPHFLRLSEIEIIGTEETQMKDELVFYGEEGKTYALYTDASFGQKSYYPEENQPLQTDDKTPVFTLPDSIANPDFDNDFDDDGLSDSVDLCPKVADHDNVDIDKNGRGDACEDPDQDGISSYKDNCPFVLNRDQNDEDADGIGDKCDTEENRVLETNDVVLWVVFGVVAVSLMFLVFRSFKSEK